MMVRVSGMLLMTLLVAAGSITLGSHVQKEYLLISESMTWDKAQKYCRDYHTDLVTIQGPDDMKTLSGIAAASSITSLIWMGLRKYGVKSWKWSSGDNPEIADYANWASLPTSSQDCGALRDDGKWLSAACNAALPFVCQTDDGSYDVILTKLTWRKAQSYCRQNMKHLARVRSQTENKAVQEVLHGNSSSFWIGLFRDDYSWSDHSDSTFRFWYDSQPNNDGLCTLYNPVTKTWWDRGCGHQSPFYCYNAISVTSWMMLKVKSNSSIHFDDSKTSHALLNQIQSKYTGVKLHWSVQPDGKSFHKSNKVNDHHQKEIETSSPCS